MKAAKVAKNLKNIVQEDLEVFKDEIFKPIGNEIGRELRPFLDPVLGSRPHEMAKEDLRRAREEKRLEEEVAVDKEKSTARVQEILNEYRSNGHSVNEQKALDEEFVELKAEISKLSHVAGGDAKAHVESAPKKVGILDVKRLRVIVKELTAKAEDAKSAQDIVSQRSNAKRTTGMQAWVSGKQMKIHEQGTLQLQG